MTTSVNDQNENENRENIKISKQKIGSYRTQYSNIENRLKYRNMDGLPLHVPNQGPGPEPRHLPCPEVIQRSCLCGKTC